MSYGKTEFTVGSTKSADFAKDLNDGLRPMAKVDFTLTTEHTHSTNANVANRAATALGERFDHFRLAMVSILLDESASKSAKGALPAIVAQEIVIALSHDGKLGWSGSPGRVKAIRPSLDRNTEEEFIKEFAIDIHFRPELVGALVVNLSGEPCGVIEGPDQQSRINSRVLSLYPIRHFAVE